MSRTIAALRALHGLTLLIGLIGATRFLIGALRNPSLVLTSHPSNLAEYASLVAIQLYIGWIACFRFGQRSAFKSLISFVVWLAIFVWSNLDVWNTDWSMSAEPTFAGHLERWGAPGIYICLYAVLPILCYTAPKRVALPLAAPPGGLKGTEGFV